jgi:hypothetical protein
MDAKFGILVLALLLLSACNNQRDNGGAGVGEPFVVTADARGRLFEKWSAAPVAGSEDLWVAGRTAVPDCARCHDARTASGTPRTKPEERASHWEVEIDHAPGMTCRTCHEARAPGELHSLAGTVSFDAAFQACGTCHREQLADWRGGAHGKRLTGWAEPRIVKNCAGCHNPHAPEIRPRMPVAHPTIIPERLRTAAEKE